MIEPFINGSTLKDVAVAVGGNGVVTVFYQADTGLYPTAICTYASLWITRSTDFGVTWPTSPTVLVPTVSEQGLSNPFIQSDLGTRFVVAYQRTQQPFLCGGICVCANQNSDVMVMSSGDSGATWSSPSVLQQGAVPNPNRPPNLI